MNCPIGHNEDNIVLLKSQLRFINLFTRYYMFMPLKITTFPVMIVDRLRIVKLEQVTFPIISYVNNRKSRISDTSHLTHGEGLNHSFHTLLHGDVVGNHGT